MKKKYTVGVVVGRFQTPYLHEGHIHLLNKASASNRRLLILVGESGGSASATNPMDFDTRASMLKSYYPEATVVAVHDNPCNKTWSEKLDDTIEKNFPDHRAILFGSRDSFIPFYEGKFPHRVIREKPCQCGSDVRRGIGHTVINSSDFRCGVVYAATHQMFPTSYQAIDIVIRHTLENKVIVGRKKGEKEWRFPGGFVDPADSSLEMAVCREAREEVGDIEISPPKYITSMQVRDHRYRKSEHKIMSALFETFYVYGHINAGDDLEEVRWQDLDSLVDNLVEVHKPLGRAFLKYLTKKEHNE